MWVARGEVVGIKGLRTGKRVKVAVDAALMIEQVHATSDIGGT